MKIVNPLRKSFLAWGFAAATALAAIAPNWAAAQDKPADVPVKRVVMFSSGVSFYEHAGDVEGNAKIDLQFNVRDINDLLKSMVLQDLGGGRISTVSYGSKDPITRTLQTFAIDLTTNPTLASLLGQVRGEKIEIEAPDKIVGTIVGIESRTQRVGKDETVQVDFVNLLTEEGLRSVSLANVGRIKLTNPKLDAELRQALAILAAAKSSDKKTVSLSFLGQGKRGVRVGYIQESPVWKTSYRLVLDDEKPPLLQGWAIVENTTESDWNDVSLQLVSGRPISFRMDLYQPLYVQRPTVQLELYASLMPRVYDQDMAAADAEFRKAGDTNADKSGLARRGALGGGFAPGAAGFGAQANRAEGKGAGRELERLEKADRANYREGFQSVAQSGDVGEMFRYTIATPVKLERSRSAMLPIVNDSVAGDKVSIYNESTHAKHPLNGLKFKNTTELHLMQGPITVFDDGAYAGDAQIQDLTPGTERLISYAMDLDTEVAPSNKAEPQQLISCRLAKGTLYTSHKLARSRSYVVKNSGKKAKKVPVEQPLDTTWKLVDPKEPAEKTRDMYRFAVAAEPGKPATLTVKEERVNDESVAVNNLPDNTISIYLSSPVVSTKVKDALRDVIKRKAAIGAVIAQRNEYDRQIKVIDVEQTRIRGNMAQLPKDSDLFRRYVKKFTEQEDEIETLREKVTKSTDEETALRKSLDDYLLGLDLS